MNEMIFIGFSLLLMTLNLFALKGGKYMLMLLIVVYTITMNVFVVKQFNLFGLAVTGGNALYGALFLATDLLSEHFGTKDARRSVYLGFFTMITFVLLMQVLLLFKTNEYDYSQDALNTLFKITPRIVVGSLLAYFIAQNIDIYIYEWIKKRTKGKHLWLRNNGSTMISQLIDTLVFTSVGLTAFEFLPFAGVIPTSIFWQNVLFTYLIKLLVAGIDTPFLYLSKHIVKHISVQDD